MKIRLIGWLLVAVCSVACSGGSESKSPANNSGREVQGALTTVSAAEFEQALKSGLTKVERTDQLFRQVQAAADQTADGRSSSTYTLEGNVDEADSVRYNGTHLFIAEPAQTSCCTISSQDGPVDSDDVSTIRILETAPSNASAIEVGEIELPENIQVSGMLLWEDQLVVVGGEERFVSYGESWVALSAAEAPRSLLMIFDVSDPESPRHTFQAGFDGSVIEVRRVDGTIFVVSRFTPYVEGLTLPVSNEAEAQSNRDTLAGYALAELLPSVTIDTQVRPLVEAQNCYVTTEGARGYPTITSITAFPLSAPEGFQSTCYNEPAYGAYVSEGAVYLTQHDYTGESYNSRVHKFSFSQTSAIYKGSADLPGLVWSGGQSDFRLSEYEGRLRAVTTMWTDDNEDLEDYELFILEEEPAAKALKVVGRLPNASRPDEIGKPGESLFGVRFVGSTAYLVTFERIDPLYVLDLSSPEDPYIAGALEVAGFSDFLHPVSDDLLLGFGRGVSGGLKLELFDVSDLSAPTSRSVYEMGAAGSTSEALYDRHAFAVFEPAEGAYRFTLPAQLTDDDGDYGIDESGLYLFEILTADDASLAQLRSVGAIVKRHENADEEWLHRSRSYIHEEAVFYVRNDEVWSVLWLDGAPANGPQ